MTGDASSSVHRLEPAQATDPTASALPQWMRAPEPPRATIGSRVTAALGRTPGATWLQRRWWAWQDRERLDQRHPVGFKIVAFFASWFLALALLLGAYALFRLA